MNYIALLSFVYSSFCIFLFCHAKFKFFNLFFIFFSICLSHRHANNVIKKAKYCGHCGLNSKAFLKELIYKSEVLAGTFQARDNISQFIKWCRELEILDCLLFETDDLVLRKNEKSFILCLLEIARRGSRFGMAAPMLVQMEQEIERELAKLDNEDEGYKEEEEEEQQQQQEEEQKDSLREEKENLKQNQDNNMKNLHEMVSLRIRFFVTVSYTLNVIFE